MIVPVALVLAGAAFHLQPVPARSMPAPVAAPRCTPPQVPERLAGRWSGVFTGADWTFEFTCKGGAWAGRYMSSKGRTWHPLLRLKVLGEAIAFGIEARPAVTYTLKLDPDAETLSGTVDIGGFHTLPFTASRQS
jgi:hypothetical protein